MRNILQFFDNKREKKKDSPFRSYLYRIEMKFQLSSSYAKHNKFKSLVTKVKIKQ